MTDIVATFRADILDALDWLEHSAKIKDNPFHVPEIIKHNGMAAAQAERIRLALFSRASLQPATKPEGCDPCGYPECGCQGRPAIGGDAVAGDAGRLKRLNETVERIGRALDAGRALAAIFPLEDDALPKAKEIVAQRLALLNVACYEFETTFKHDIAALRSPDVAGDVQAATSTNRGDK